MFVPARKGIFGLALTVSLGFAVTPAYAAPNAASGPTAQFAAAPAIEVLKSVNGQDANSAPGPHVPVGSTLTFTYLVANTGNVPLLSVAVTDDKLPPPTFVGGDTNGNGLLEAPEIWTYTETATALAGQQTNVGTATAQDAMGTQAIATDPANYFGDAPTAVTFASASAHRTRQSVLVRWRTGTEADLLGFQVYRSRGHSWRRITRSLIAAKGSVSGAAYRFLDRKARRGVSYRYRVKAVNRDGTAAWFGPVRVT